MGKRCSDERKPARISDCHGYRSGRGALYVGHERETRNILNILASEPPETSLPLQVVMNFRADPIGELHNIPVLVNMNQALPISPIPIERYREVIEVPARVAGLEVEPAFVDRSIRDTQTEDALPLLAFAHSRLYDRVSKKGELTLDGYAGMSGSGVIPPAPPTPA